MTTMTVARCSTRLLTLLSILGLVSSEIRTFSGIIEAASTFIHYSEGYLVAPAFIDISNLVFQTIDDGGKKAYVLDKRVPEEDDALKADDDESGDDDAEADGGDRGGRHVRLAADDTSLGGSTVDIVFFYEPKQCSNNRAGCDWTKLGIGADDGQGGLRWCCSKDAVEFGFCQGGNSQYGRLIVNSTSFKGQHRFITVPASGKLETTVKYGKLEEPDDSGKYILIIANCNDEGRDVMVNGKYTWESKHGFLPGDLFGEMFFFAGWTAVYLVIAMWYGCSMWFHADAKIPIQTWIFWTIMMGLMESFFKTGDLLVWNEDGTRFWFAMYTGVLVGALKRGISRCLVVMVSLGWGVVRDSLGSTMNKIIVLGVVYVGTSTARDIMTLFAITDNQTLSIDEEAELFDAVTILTFVVAAIDVTFYLWILDGMNATMQYLENMSQTTKLQRYLRLRLILLFSILFAVVWSVFSIVNTAMEDAILQEQQEWAVDAAMEINYLMVLVCVAVLWRPNPNAKEYAYVTEIPAMGGEDGEDELEMTGNIPSAMDDDDEDDESGGTATKNGGYSDEPSFQIDDAVHT